MDTYSFDNCIICKQHKPLKNNVCFECSQRTPENLDMPDIFRDIFNTPNDNTNKRMR